MTFLQFLDKYFDKLLLLILVEVFVALYIFLTLHADKDGSRWAENQISMIIGGLVGLATGVAIGRASIQSNRDGSATATLSASDISPKKD